MVRRLLLAVVLAASVVPLLYLGILTLTPQSEVLSGSVLPGRLTTDNWPAFWQRMPILSYGVNSVVAAIAGAVLSLAIATPVAYAIVRYRTGGEFLPTFVLSAFVAPPVVAVIPMFFLLRYAGLLNSSLGLALIYGLVNVSVATWLLHGFVERIPHEIEEAAQIDGAGVLRTIWHVVLPLLAPGLVATGTILLILNYNEFLFALTVTQRAESQTLPVAISLFQGDRGVQFGQMAAASVTAMVPVYLAATLLQKWLVGGLTSGGVK
ncbi:carbohydrate ABC transporter permease [Pseudonocardia hispaniensis]|uniref:Carbohydrate ABC transporter permease n=1 Tax=Pseudonocardia hispaniensis TaxID=904933 RepID=A0ABW1J6E8_9PSEU